MLKSLLSRGKPDSCDCSQKHQKVDEQDPRLVEQIRQAIQTVEVDTNDQGGSYSQANKCSDQDLFDSDEQARLAHRSL